MNKIYLLQGIIFQNGSIYGIGNKPGIGSAATIKPAMIFAMFHGIVGPNVLNELTGEMSDKWGESSITNFELTENTLTYIKHYNCRPPIHYSFTKKEDGSWSGKYSGIDCGEGEANIHVVETFESFLSPESIKNG